MRCLYAGFYFNSNISIFMEIHKSERKTNLNPIVVASFFYVISFFQARDEPLRVKKISTQAIKTA